MPPPDMAAVPPFVTLESLRTIAHASVTQHMTVNVRSDEERDDQCGWLQFLDQAISAVLLNFLQPEESREFGGPSTRWTESNLRSSMDQLQELQDAT
ncbi:hypothetical protein MRB53_037971 [Persea americana]|nr:hypothetical protein MRB53_037971 [Persea americana]